MVECDLPKVDVVSSNLISRFSLLSDFPIPLKIEGRQTGWCLNFAQARQRNNRLAPT